MKNDKPTYEIVQEENRDAYDKRIKREMGYFKDVMEYTHMSMEDKLERFESALEFMYYNGVLDGHQYARERAFEEKMKLIDKLYPLKND